MMESGKTTTTTTLGGASATFENERMAGREPLTGALPPIDVDKDRFPCCIVWSPLPCISWFLPMIGHMGICDSAGVTYDFGGPYYISEDRMTFGAATRYLQLKPAKATMVPWDRAVRDANDEYRKRMHNLFCDNCHSHVAYALNKMAYEGKTNWNMVILGWHIFAYGSFTSFGGFLKTWLPFLIILTIIVIISSTVTSAGVE
eukprot:m.8586 g.8586  ORF g.8586 m.8586 type:complete len:202 (-) comp2551_c0_seq1:263-868(-)